MKMLNFLKTTEGLSKRGWTLTVNGQVVENVESMTLSNPAFGQLEYGAHPSAPYDLWAFEQTHGGVVTIPYVRLEDGRLLFGLLPENRPNMGDKPQLCIMGGFKLPNARGDVEQAREALEEGGVDTFRAEPLPGEPNNWNRAFHVTRNGNGDQAYALEIAPEWVEQYMKGMVNEWRLKPECPLIVDNGKAANLVFLPWRDAIARTPDGIARAAMAQALIVLIHEAIPVAVRKMDF